MLFRKYCQDFFNVPCCLEPLGQHGIGFFLYNVVLGLLRQHCTGFFTVQCFLALLGQYYLGF